MSLRDVIPGVARSPLEGTEGSETRPETRPRPLAQRRRSERRLELRVALFGSFLASQPQLRGLARALRPRVPRWLGLLPFQPCRPQ
jgi:hypothetical protein